MVANDGSRTRATGNLVLGTTAALAVAIAVAACGACGGAAATLPHDDSTAQPTARAGASGAIVPISPEVRAVLARGPVASIAVEELAPGSPASRVEIAGGGAAAERTFRIALPPEIPIPFAVGDSIVLRIETLPGPPTWQPMNAVVTTEDGELLAMSGVTPPPGWQIESAGEARRVDRGDYDEIENYVTFTHAGKTAVADGASWRRLATDDGVWLVTGRSTALEGEIPADGGGTFSFMIVRAR